MNKWYLQRCCLIKSAHLGSPFRAFGRHLGCQPPTCCWRAAALSPWTAEAGEAGTEPLSQSRKHDIPCYQWEERLIEKCIKAVMSSIYMYWLEVGPPFLIYHHRQLGKFSPTSIGTAHIPAPLVLYCFSSPSPPEAEGWSTGWNGLVITPAPPPAATIAKPLEWKIPSRISDFLHYHCIIIFDE